MTIIEIITPKGFRAEVLTYGATLIGLYPINKERRRTNVVLRYPTIEDYKTHPAYLGSTVGRWAGRIKDGRFMMDGRLIDVDTATHPNGHHGGPFGISHVEWTVVDQCPERVVLEYQDNYVAGKAPGDVIFRATYRVFEYGEEEILEIVYDAMTTEKTYLNLTNHAYFNLSDTPKSVENHWLKLKSNEVAYVDDYGIPYELLTPVTKTPFDFNTSKGLADILSSEDQQIIQCRGLDHPFSLEGKEGVVELYAPDTGRVMRLDTNQPYCVVYSGNYNDAWELSNGERLNHQGGICFEMQKIPNAPNRQDQTDLWLEPHQVYHHETRYRFSVLSISNTL